MTNDKTREKWLAQGRKEAAEFLEDNLRDVGENKAADEVYRVLQDYKKDLGVLKSQQPESEPAAVVRNVLGLDSYGNYHAAVISKTPLRRDQELYAGPPPAAQVPERLTPATLSTVKKQEQQPEKVKSSDDDGTEHF